MGSELRDLRKHTDELYRGALESQVTHGVPCLSLAKCNNPLVTVTDLDSSQQVVESWTISMGLYIKADGGLWFEPWIFPSGQNGVHNVEPEKSLAFSFNKRSCQTYSATPSL